MAITSKTFVYAVFISTQTRHQMSATLRDGANLNVLLKIEQYKIFNTLTAMAVSVIGTPGAKHVLSFGHINYIKKNNRMHN